MQWRDNGERYGAVTVALHWLVAVTVFGMFSLGLWMTGLTYYDAWYRLGPWWHKGVGVALFAVMGLRLVWRLSSGHPRPLPTHRAWERAGARAVHAAIYVLLFAIMLSGYLISTADGRPLSVFDWFAIPATVSGIEHQEDIAGRVHLVLASTLIGLVALHVLAVLKHRFVDKDRTLARMLGR